MESQRGLLPFSAISGKPLSAAFRRFPPLPSKGSMAFRLRAVSNPKETSSASGPNPASRRWLNALEMANHLGVSRRQVSNLMRRRVLPYVKIGRVVRFDLEACEQALRHFEIQSVGQIKGTASAHVASPKSQPSNAQRSSPRSFMTATR